MEPAVETLRVEDDAEAATVLARAFRDNPAMIALLDSDDPARRLALLSRLTPIFVACYRTHGDARVVRDGARIAGVALALAPGRYPPSFRLEASLVLGVARRLPLHVGVRLGVADLFLRAHHLRGPHHYLFMLGVDPEQQGRGHGGTLLRDLSRRAEADGVPCYLETDKPASVQLYQHHGYAVTHERHSPRIRNLKLWFMQRPRVT